MSWKDILKASCGSHREKIDTEKGSCGCASCEKQQFEKNFNPKRDRKGPGGLTDEQRERYYGKKISDEERLKNEENRKEYEAKVDRKRKFEERKKKEAEERRRRYEERKKEEERLGKIHGLYECKECANMMINYDNLKIDDLKCDVCGAEKGDSWISPFIHRIKGEKEE